MSFGSIEPTTFLMAASATHGMIHNCTTEMDSYTPAAALLVHACAGAVT